MCSEVPYSRCQGGVGQGPHPPNICLSSAEIIAFTGCWLNLAHPSRNCFLWVFMKNVWDLGIMELYPSKAKHLLKHEKKKKKNKIRTEWLWGCGVASLLISNLNCDKTLVIWALWMRRRRRRRKIILQYLEIRQIYGRGRKTKPRKTNYEKRQKSETGKIIKGTYKWVIKKE